jgi:5,10-methenyltetrahydromethanopterin hydrogenase
MISVFQKIDFFLQLADYVLNERVGGDLGIMAYHCGKMPSKKRRVFGRAGYVNRRDIRAVWTASDPLHELSFDVGARIFFRLSGSIASPCLGGVYHEDLVTDARCGKRGP